MDIFLIGINHKTAPIEVREKFFLNPLQQDLFLSELKSHPLIAEALVLSTCNRTEVYVYGLPMPRHMDFFLSLISNIKKSEFLPDVQRHFYSYQNAEAVRHFLQVTAGLDSLILGEKQIIGQVRNAVERARQKGMFGRYFNILSNLALRTAKKAQNETEISYGGSSVSWAAMALAENRLTTLEGKSILIIGAGKMGELALEQIRSKGVRQIYLMNRTETTAQDLARTYSGIAASFCDIKEILSEVDVCVCSAGAPHYILDKITVEKTMALRNHRELILIDISMPRNIDPAAAQVEGISLFHIDDLEQVFGETMRKRQSAVRLVEDIIEGKMTAFYKKISFSESPELLNQPENFLR